MVIPHVNPDIIKLFQKYVQYEDNKLIKIVNTSLKIKPTNEY